MGGYWVREEAILGRVVREKTQWEDGIVVKIWRSKITTEILECSRQRE